MVRLGVGGVTIVVALGLIGEVSLIRLQFKGGSYTGKLSV